MRMVVDASIAIKWLVPEEDYEKALSIAAAHQLIAPQLIYAECANIIWKKVRKGELTTREAREAAFFIDTFHVQTVALRELLDVALELSLHLDHAVYDCFYLALAILDDCQFVTADRKFKGAITARLGATDAHRCLLLSSL
jgi:predicted nucleic acid-binding protein